MKKLLLTVSLALLGATAAHAQQEVCMSAPETGKVCLTLSGQTEPACPAGFPGVTLVQQATDVSVVLAGTQVCVLRIVPGSQIAGDPLVVVLARHAIASENGSTQIVTREAAYYASQISGATVSSALTLSK